MYRCRGTCCILDLGFQVATRRPRGQDLSKEAVQRSVDRLDRDSLRLAHTNIHDLDIQGAATLPYDHLFGRYETCGFIRDPHRLCLTDKWVYTKVVADFIEFKQVFEESV